MPTIAVNCNAPLVPLKELTPFQGSLKTLTKENYNKLRESINRHGIAFPFVYWEHEGVKYILDAHQRKRVLEGLIADGHELEGGMVPAVAVAAPDEAKAKELVLLAASQYGEVTDEGLYEFLHTAELNFDSIKEVLEFPAVDLRLFGRSYYDEPLPPSELRPQAPASAEGVSHVRMVQLFFNEEQHVRFLEVVQALGDAYGLTNPSDVLLKVLDEALEENNANADS